MLSALLPFAGFAVMEVARAVKSRDKQVLLGSAVGLAAFGLLVNTDLYGVGRAHGANRDYFYLGQCYDTQGDRTQAREAFLRATEADPKDADAWAFLGSEEMALGENEAAAEHLRKALDVAPDYARAAGRLAEISLNENWPLADAKRRLEKALSTQSDNVEGRIALVKLNLRENDTKSAAKNLEALADSFSRFNPSSKQYAQLQAQVMAVAGEAQAKGIAVPEKLRNTGAQQPTTPTGGY